MKGLEYKIKTPEIDFTMKEFHMAIVVVQFNEKSVSNKWS